MDLRDFLNVVRTRRWVIVQAVLIVALVAAVVSIVRPPVYEGEAKVLIDERDTGAALFGTVLPELSSQPERSMQTQVQLMQVRPLAENTIRKLGLQQTPERLLGNVRVSSAGQTNIIRIVARDEDPDRAAEIANTMAEEFVAWSRDYRRESITAAVGEVEQRLQGTKEEILALGRRLEDEGQSDELDAELQIATGAYVTLAEKLEQLKIYEQLETGSGRIVSPAVVATTPVEPDPVRNGAVGLAVGMVFGLAMAFLNEYLDDTIKSSAEAENLFGAPVLGVIPEDRGGKGEGRRLVIRAEPGSPIAEAYRGLRNSLDFINFQQDIKTLVVTSPAPAEGKSTVAANLALSLAQAGKKVVIVECDFRRPTTAQFFNVSHMIGLSDVLSGAHSVKSALQRPGEEDLLVLTSGKRPPNPSELLASAKMAELVETLEEWADWVIIDTPPVLAVADSAAVARWADGVLMVTRGGGSSRDAARKCVEVLGNVGARIVGSVVWGLDTSRSQSGYGYYGYGTYSYYYSDATVEKKRGKGAVPPKAKAAEGATKEVEPADVYVPPVSPTRRFLAGVGKFLKVMLSVVAILAILALVLYFLDQTFGWGLLNEVLGFFDDVLALVL